MAGLCSNLIVYYFIFINSLLIIICILFISNKIKLFYLYYFYLIYFVSRSRRLGGGSVQQRGRPSPERDAELCGVRQELPRYPGGDRALSTLRGLRGAPEVPPFAVRETQSLGQQMKNW